MAICKAAMHARAGGRLEVMGVMTGKILKETFLVLDVVPLPVEGTETRVNAQAEAYEYMVDFLETMRSSGRDENVVGWYHSHPGYGCWLSGIDVSTQMTNQKYQDPFVAVVIDPHASVTSNSVAVGAFRTLPEGHTSSEEYEAFQNIPLEKIEDFGVHAKQYYDLRVGYLKNEFDHNILGLVQGEYWASALDSKSAPLSEIISTRRTSEIAKKIEASGMLGKRSVVEDIEIFRKLRSGSVSKQKGTVIVADADVSFILCLNEKDIWY